mmetsp:Transcript_30059/g.76567  ORF Transcript_30059/g.76567 Transcript_30059/m.76567 type:complete len:236 (-) Transcript_30059:131-838(-)
MTRAATWTRCWRPRCATCATTPTLRMTTMTTWAAAAGRMRAAATSRRTTTTTRRTATTRTRAGRCAALPPRRWPQPRRHTPTRCPPSTPRRRASWSTGSASARRTSRATCLRRTSRWRARWARWAAWPRPPTPPARWPSCVATCRAWCARWRGSSRRRAPRRAWARLRCCASWPRWRPPRWRRSCLRSRPASPPRCRTAAAPPAGSRSRRSTSRAPRWPPRLAAWGAWCRCVCPP